MPCKPGKPSLQKDHPLFSNRSRGFCSRVTDVQLDTVGCYISVHAAAQHSLCRFDPEIKRHSLFVTTYNAEARLFPATESESKRNAHGDC